MDFFSLTQAYEAGAKPHKILNALVEGFSNGLSKTLDDIAEERIEASQELAETSLAAVTLVAGFKNFIRFVEESDDDHAGQIHILLILEGIQQFMDIRFNAADLEVLR